MTTLYVNGCSWTAGSELEHEIELFEPWAETQYAKGISRDDFGLPEFYNMHNWPSFLGRKLNATVINDALGGGSNQRMIRTTLNYINSLTDKEQSDLVVVLGWTSAERSEIFIDEPIIRGWHRFNMTQPFGDFLFNWQKDIAVEKVKSIEKMQEHYLAAGLSLFGCVETYLQQQFLMKNTLENLGIRYLFFQSVPAWWDDWMNVNVYEELGSLLKETEHKNNIGIYFNDAMQTVCNIKGFKHGPAIHVLRDGHKYWAEEVLFPKLLELYGA